MVLNIILHSYNNPCILGGFQYATERVKSGSVFYPKVIVIILELMVVMMAATMSVFFLSLFSLITNQDILI